MFLVNNKVIYPLVGLKIADFTTIKVEQDKKQISYYFSKLTYLIKIYFIIVFYTFFIYFLSLVINIGFSEPFKTALLSTCCTISAILVGTYFARFYQQWKNKVVDFKKQYYLIYKRIMMFHRFLVFSDLNNINFDTNKMFIEYHFFPNYLLNWIQEGNYENNKAILIYELLMWKKYLNNLEYLNELSWVKCLHILIDDQYNFSTKFKKVILNNIIKIENEITNCLQEQTNCLLVKNLIINQSYQFLWTQLFKKRAGLRQIKHTLKVLSFIPKEKQLKHNPLVEENLDLNIFQLNYLKFLFSIVDY